jgi:hypothetical protein
MFGYRIKIGTILEVSRNLLLDIRSRYRIYSITEHKYGRLSNIGRPDIENPGIGQNERSITKLVRLSDFDCICHCNLDLAFKSKSYYYIASKTVCTVNARKPDT